jgi:hypothetical protein
MHAVFPSRLPAELQYLDLSANYIIGTLPSTLGDMASLRLLNLGKNGFTDLGQGEFVIGCDKVACNREPPRGWNRPARHIAAALSGAHCFY